MPAYPYKPKTVPVLFAFALFAALAAASANLVHSSSGSAKFLLILVTALFAGMTIFFFLALKNSFSSARRIELSDGQLSIPISGYSNSIAHIKTTHITGLSLQQVQKHKILKIAHINGNLTMHSALFPDVRKFERMCEAIQKATLESREAKSKPASAAHPAAEAMKQAIEEKRRTDPLVGAKIGGKEVVQWLIAMFKTEKGVHIESLLSALGSLAGYACQSSVREEFLQTKKLPESQVFITARGADGKNYYFGDLLNKPLAESQYSVWALAAGTAQHLGSRDLVDLNNIFEHVAQTVGDPSFGVPRIPENHSPSEAPANYVKHIWPKTLPLLEKYCVQPAEWPILFGIAIQEVQTMGKNVIDPSLALSIVMESAVPMSKVDFNTL